MSGPKHLWSGDWQRESEAASASRAQRAPTGAPPPASEPPPETPPRGPRRRLAFRGTTVLVAAAVLVLAGVAFGLSALLSSSPARHRTNPTGPVAQATAPTVPTVPTVPAIPTVPPQTAPLPVPTPQSQTTPATPQPPQSHTTPAVPQPAPVANTPTVNWLGMTIATQAPGAAVVQTVRIGSPGDHAGINPGDVIVAVDGRAIHSAQGIAGALHGLSPGDRVTLQLAYGSGYSQAQLTLGAPPSVAP
jgi:membrane-associated protease RseP (regulator of RpoE activity)